MAYITWQDGYSVGLADIDFQHQKLVEIINDLHASLETNDPLGIRSTFDALVNYILFHFGYEESNFVEKGFPDSDAHKRAHFLFIEKILHLRDQLENGDVNVGANMLLFLKRWLMTHIQVSDREMADWINQNEESPSRCQSGC